MATDSEKAMRTAAGFPASRSSVAFSLALLLSACEASNAVLTEEREATSTYPTQMAGTLGRPLAAAGSGAIATPRPDGQPRVPPTATGSAGTAVTGKTSTAGATGTPTTPAPCPATGHVRAVHVTVDVSWPESLGITGGTGQMHIWNAMTFGPPGSEIPTEIRACGADVPAQTTTAVAGGYMVQGQVPYSAYESASMPKERGTATKQGAQLTINSTIAVLGMEMADRAGTWPSSAQAATVTSVDSDDDGKPGITAIPRQDTGFSLVPINLFQSEFADELYSAQRSSIRLSGIENGCPETIEGEALVERFDTLVIGCHIKGGGVCTPDEVKFLNDSRPIMKRVKAVWTARLAPDAVSCAEVRALVP